MYMTPPEDARKLAQSGLKENAHSLLAILQTDPFQNPLPYEQAPPCVGAQSSTPASRSMSSGKQKRIMKTNEYIVFAVRISI